MYLTDVGCRFHPCLSSASPALFALEINVTKNLLTGEKAVVSTATVPAEELKRHAGLKVYDDGRRCVYALSSPEVRPDEALGGCYRNGNDDAPF